MITTTIALIIILYVIPVIICALDLMYTTCKYREFEWDYLLIIFFPLINFSYAFLVTIYFLDEHLLD